MFNACKWQEYGISLSTRPKFCPSALVRVWFTLVVEKEVRQIYKLLHFFLNTLLIRQLENSNYKLLQVWGYSRLSLIRIILSSDHVY